MSTTMTLTAARPVRATRRRVRLPLELALEIIDTLCALPAASHTQPRCVVRTLCALALTCKALHHRAMYHLYRDITLPSPSSLPFLIDCNCVGQRSPVQSISILPQRVLLSRPRKSPRPLPSADPPDLFLRVFLHLAPSLEHLTLLTDLTPIGHSSLPLLNSTLLSLSLPNLRSLSLAGQPHHAFPHFWFPDNPCSWPNLRRLALHQFHPVSAEQCAIGARCPGLRELVLGWNGWDGEEEVAHAVEVMLCSLSGVKRLKLVYPGAIARSSTLGATSSAARDGRGPATSPKTRVAHLCGSTRIEDVDPLMYGVKEQGVSDWVLGRMEDGRIWEMGGRVWGL